MSFLFTLRSKNVSCNDHFNVSQWWENTFFCNNCQALKLEDLLLIIKIEATYMCLFGYTFGVPELNFSHRKMIFYSDQCVWLPTDASNLILGGSGIKFGKSKCLYTPHFQFWKVKWYFTIKPITHLSWIFLKIILYPFC